MKLEHIEVRHEHEVIGGSLLQGLNNEVVHDDEVVEEVGDAFLEEEEGLVEVLRLGEGGEDGDEGVDDVVEFENPDEADLGASPEDLVEGDFPLLAGLVQLLVAAQLHYVVVFRNQQFLEDELLQLLSSRLDLVVPELRGLREGFYLFFQNYVAHVVLRYFGDLDQARHYLQLAGVAGFLLQLLYHHFQERLL